MFCHSRRHASPGIAGSGLAVTFSSTTPTIYSVSGNIVTGIATGTCTIAADQSGNANYNVATRVTQNITVGKTSQTISQISFNPPTLNVGGTTTASTTASSGLVVTFKATTPRICSVNGNTVTGIAAGTCTIAANQAGNANYNAAPQVTQSITIAPNKPDKAATQNCSATGGSMIWDIGDIPIGQSKAFNINMTGLTPSIIGEKKTLRAFIDSECAMVESNEKNNQRILTYSVRW